MMKNLLAIAVFCLSFFLFSPLGVAQDKTNTCENTDAYVEGLKQFKYFKTPDNLVLARIVGYSHDYDTFASDADLVIVNVDFFTEECRVVSFRISINRYLAEVWLHEVTPIFGKYRFWHQVVIIPRKKDGSTVNFSEISHEGRFFIKYGGGYLFENFRRPE